LSSLLITIIHNYIISSSFSSRVWTLDSENSSLESFDRFRESSDHYTLSFNRKLCWTGTI